MPTTLLRPKNLVPPVALVDCVAGRASELPVEVGRAALASAVFSLLGLGVLVIFAIVMITLAHDDSGMTVAAGFAAPRVAKLVVVIVAFVFAGAWIEECFFRGEPLIGEPTELEAHPRVLALRVLFLIPHLMLHSVRIGRDAFDLNTTPIDSELAARVLMVCRGGATEHELVALHADPRARRVAVAALAHAGWISAPRNGFTALTIEGTRLFERR